MKFRPSTTEKILWHQDLVAHLASLIRDHRVKLAQCVDMEEFDFWANRLDWYQVELATENDNYEQWSFNY